MAKKFTVYPKQTDIPITADDNTEDMVTHHWASDEQLKALIDDARASGPCKRYASVEEMWRDLDV